VQETQTKRKREEERSREELKEGRTTSFKKREKTMDGFEVIPPAPFSCLKVRKKEGKKGERRKKEDITKGKGRHRKCEPRGNKAEQLKQRFKV